MDGVISVGGWEHECCGAAVERNEVHRRVKGLRVVRDDGSQQPGRRFVVVPDLSGSTAPSLSRGLLSTSLQGRDTGRLDARSPPAHDRRMGEPGAEHADPGDASTLRIPSHPPRPRRTRRRRVAAVAVLVATVAGLWVVASRTQEAMWFLPADHVPDPTSSTVTVMVQEPGCDSGAPPSIVRPRVDLDETTVTIAVSTRARWELSGSCLGGAPTPLTVDLGEPLGDRTLVDAHGDLDDTWAPVEVRAPGLEAPDAADR